MSLASGGTQGNGDSANWSTSADGRYVAFQSIASDLVPGDANGQPDIFVRDRVVGTTERVSVSSDGIEGDHGSEDPEISGDGRYVAFSSRASNLVSGDTNATWDVFVRDRVAGTTQRVSVSSSGAQGDNQSAYGPVISPDGRYVAFGSLASNLVANDTNGTTDTFVRDRVAGTTERVSVASNGAQGNGESAVPSISADGRYVAFFSGASNLVTGDTNATWDVFVRDRTAGTTERVSVDSNGTQGNAGSVLPTLSADGRFVVFYSSASNLVAGDTNAADDVYIRDRTAGTTQRVSVDSGGAQGNGTSLDPTVSPDGRYVVFSSVASNLVAGDTNGSQDVFLYDRMSGRTERVSVSSSGGEGNGISAYRPDISADGRFVSFWSRASNLVDNDTNAVADIFVRERSLSQAPPVGGNVTPESRRGGGSPSTHLGVCPEPVADPCDVSTGNFWETFTDLAIPGRGMPLAFTRTYNSVPAPSAPVDGPFGYGWSFNDGMSLTIAGDLSSVTVNEENGAQVVFSLANGLYMAPPWVLATLVRNGDGTWTFTRRAREIYVFNSSGRLTAQKDLNGYTTSLSYTGSQLTAVTDPAGRTLSLGWTGSRITTVTDTASPPRSVTFSYDGSGNLTDVVDVGGGHWTFGYDTNHRMTTKREPKYYGDTTTTPAPVTTNHYDASGRLDWQTDPLGRQTTFDYTSIPGSTKVTDPKGNVRVDAFSYGLLTARTLGYGTAQAATWDYVYDPATLGMISVADPNGHATTSVYDAAGKQTSTTDPLGRTTTATYDDVNQPRTVTDQAGVTTTYDRDAAGNLLSESTPLVGSNPPVSRTVTYTYADPVAHPGDVTSITDPDGKVWPRTWDANGNLATVTDPLGNMTRYCYDGVGRRIKIIAPKGTAAGVTCATANPTYTTTITPDAFGAPLSVTDPLGHRTQYGYDLNRNRKSVIDPMGQTTTYSYDPADQLIQESRPSSVLLADLWTGADGGAWNAERWQTTPNDTAKKVDLQGGEGRLWVTTLAAARATAQMAPVADSEAAFSFRFSDRTARSYLRVLLRASGATGANVMPNGYRLEVQSDSNTIKLQRVQNSSTTTLASFTHTLDISPQRVRFQVQGSTIRVKVWAAATGEPSTWSKEVSDSAITTPGVLQIAHNGSNEAPTRSVYVDDLSVVDSASLAGAAWTSPVRVSDLWTGTNETAWNGDRWGATANDANKKADIWDNQGRLWVTGGSARATARQMPDVADSEVTLTYAFANRTNDTTLRVGLRSSGVDKGAGAAMPNAYRLEIRALGPTIRIKKTVNDVVTELGSFSYTQDILPQRVRFQVQGSTIRAKVWSVGTSEPATWSKEVTDTEITTPGVLQIAHARSSGTNEVKIDDLAVSVGSSVRYDYHPDGALWHSYDGANQATTYAYDAVGRVTSVTDPLNRTTTYGYDQAGNRTTTQDPGGNCAAVPKLGCTTMSYDAADQLVGIDYSDPSTPDVTSVGYDLNGRRTTMTDGTGTSSWGWDSLGRLKSSTNGAGKTVGSDYDLRGNLTKITYPGATGAVTRTYDNAGRLTKVKDWLNHETVFNYDADSFLTGQVYPNGTTATYTPDAADRLMDVSHAPTATPLVPFAKFAYGRDNADRLTSVASTGVGDNRAWTYAANDQLKTDNGAMYASDEADNLIRLTTGAVQGYDVAHQMTSTSAISVVGAAGAADSLSPSLTLALPVGTTTDDQILLAATVPYAQTPATPTGYTVAGTYAAGTSAKVVVFRRTATSGETTVPVDFGGVYGKALNLVVYRGVDPTSPIDTGQSAAATGGSSVTVPSLTPAVPGERLVFIQGAVPTSAGKWSIPVDTTPQGAEQQPVDGSAAGLITDQSLLTTGASGPRTATFSTSGGLVGVLFALKPRQAIYGYDARGNRTSVTPPTGSATSLSYDQANRLTAYGAAGTYTYKGDGLRMSKTVSGSTSSFTWDEAEGLPLLLVDGSTNYVYGPGGVPLAQITSAGVVTYYHHDHLGSTGALTNSSGAVVATYTYDAYGNLTAGTGSATNPFRFTGEYTDPETGLIYGRSRYYDPATGQFLNRTSATAVGSYTYASGDPLNRARYTLGLGRVLSEEPPQYSPEETACHVGRDLCYETAKRRYERNIATGMDPEEAHQIRADDEYQCFVWFQECMRRIRRSNPPTLNPTDWISEPPLPWNPFDQDPRDPDVDLDPIERLRPRKPIPRPPDILIPGAAWQTCR